MPVDSQRAREIAERIPEGFSLGVATSSWQIEGASDQRGRSIWDDFADTPGRIVDGASADPACDHLNHIEADLDLVAGLGANAYRFSFSWPRVLPNGVGAPSRKGLDVYDRLVDNALERGLTPFATLYHWDFPSTLHEKGGWLNPDSQHWFADYAHLMGEHFGDRVDTFATLNEPWVSAFLGYAAGVHAPGEQNPAASLEVFYRLMVASGHGIRALREAGVKNPGIVLNLTTVIADDEGVAEQAMQIDALQNTMFLDLLAGRGLPEIVIDQTAGITDWSFVTPEGLEYAATPVSWLGINYYTPTRIASPGGSSERIVGQNPLVYPGVRDVAFVSREPKSAMGWEIHPESLTTTLVATHQRLPGVALYVTENGGAFEDVVEVSGIHDTERVAYFADHLHAALDAVDQGVDLRGYFAWSLFDNLEWAEGWTKRFGIIRVVEGVPQRTLKDSALFLREVFSGHA